jgi:hypothetical protein
VTRRTDNTLEIPYIGVIESCDTKDRQYTGDTIYRGNLWHEEGQTIYWYLQCIVCHSSCHSFLLPLYMVSPVYCLSFVSQLSITSIYGISSVLSVLLRVTAFYFNALEIPYIGEIEICTTKNDRQYTGDTIYRGNRKLWHEQWQTIHWRYHI